MTAAVLEDPTALVVLLDAGAAVDARNHVGETALFLAAEAGRAGSVRVLLERGADAGLPCTGEDARSRRLGIRGVARAGTTPAQIARRSGHVDVLALLEP